MDLESHQEEVITFTKASCKSKGLKKYKCNYCLQNFEEEIGIQQHDFILKQINSKTEGTCKDCGKKFSLLRRLNLVFGLKKKMKKDF